MNHALSGVDERWQKELEARVAARARQAAEEQRARDEMPSPPISAMSGNFPAGFIVAGVFIAIALFVLAVMAINGDLTF